MSFNVFIHTALAPEHHQHLRRLERRNPALRHAALHLVAQQPQPLWNNSWLKKKIAADLGAFPFFPCHGYGTIALTKSSPRESELWFYGTMVNSASRRHGRLPRNFCTAPNLPIDSIVDCKTLKETGQLISFNERISYEEIVG